jgi:hypothetical protein
MTNPSLVKKTLKFLILGLFLLDRLLVYRDLKAKESILGKDLHHELIKGYEVDFGKLNEKYDTHHLFNIPFTKKIVGNGLDYIMHKFNLNQTLKHQGHSHPDDMTHDFQNKLIDVDSKYKFFFLTAYDILMITFIYFLINRDSLFSNTSLLIDTGLKVFGSLVYHHRVSRFKWFDYLFYSMFGKEKHGLEKVWNEIKNFTSKEKYLLTNATLFSLLFILFLWILSEKMMRKGLDISSVAEVAKETRQVIQEKLHQMGVGSLSAQEETSTIAKSPKKVQMTGDKTSPDLMTLRTVETEENKPQQEPQDESSFSKIVETPVTTQEQNIRPTRADNNEIKERKRSLTPSKRRIPQQLPTL